MLALRPQARFGGQPGRKARLLGRRSSREPHGGANARGRGGGLPLAALVNLDQIQPYKTKARAVRRAPLPYILPR